MGEPQRAERFPERDVVVDRQQSAADVDGQKAFFSQSVSSPGFAR